MKAQEKYPDCKSVTYPWGREVTNEVTMDDLFEG